MEKKFLYEKFANKITNKSIVILDDGSQYQTLESIVVGLTPIPYYVFHEVCHFIVATSDDKKKYNLRYGIEKIMDMIVVIMIIRKKCSIYLRTSVL
jgi:hypothetical protein